MDHPYETWSDKRCVEISKGNNFSTAVKDIDTQKAIISRFLNFYLSGNVPKGLTVADVIFAVISIMPFHRPDNNSNECFIWKESHYSDDGTLFFLSPNDKLEHDIKLVMKKNEMFEQKLNNDSEFLEKRNIHEENLQEFNISFENEKSLESDISSEVEKFQDDKLSQGKNLTQNEDEIMNNSLQDENSLQNEKSPKEIFIKNELNIIKWFRLKLPKVDTSQTDIQYGPVENAAFCISCNNLLDQWSNVSARKTLKYFFGVTALVLMRARVKSFHNITKFFSNKFSSLYSTSVIKYSPPNKSCIKKCWKAFVKLTPETQIMYAKIVVNSFYIDKKINLMSLDDLLIHLATYEQKNIFKMCILMHMANFGMGIIGMLQTIALRTCRFSTVLECLQSEQTTDSLNKVMEYIHNYMINSKQVTHHWSRVIDPMQFPFLCCKNNYNLSVIIAAFIEKLTNSTEIWKSSWVTGKQNELSSLKNIGFRMYEKYEGGLRQDTWY